METAEFSIPLLAEERQALDLSNALNAVKGVAGVRTDVQRHAVTVEYDDGFTSRGTLGELIRQAGYPIGDGR
jgi:copper chaperone CopZ